MFWPTSCIHSSQTHVLEYKGLVIHFCSSASLIRDTHCSCHALSDIMEISRLRALDSDAAGKKKRLSGSLIYCSWRDWEGKKSKTGLFVLSLTPDCGLRQLPICLTKSSVWALLRPHNSSQTRKNEQACAVHRNSVYKEH